MYNDEQLSPVGKSSVPVPNRMLRRLKKATSISDLCPESKTLAPEEQADGEDLEDPIGGFEEEDGLRSDLEGLGVDSEITARKALDFDSVPEFNSRVEDLGEKGDDEISDLETREDVRVTETKEAEKERTSVPEFDSALEDLGEKVEDEISDLEPREDIRSVPEFDSVLQDLGEKVEDEISDLEPREDIRVSDETSVPEFDSELEEMTHKGEDEDSDFDIGEEIRVSETNEARKKRPVPESSDSERKETKRSKKSVNFDELPISTASMNMTKKERREYLDQLRAENQRLLRETRDAAFEPVPLVRKPISSVLEKIRRRKEEISKQFLSRNKSKSIDPCDSLLKDDDNGSEEVVAEEKNEDMNLEFTSKQNPEEHDCLEDSDSPSNKNAESNPTHQDQSSPSQTTNSGDVLLEKTSSRSLEEVMTPSILAMKLKLNPSPPPKKISEEAEESSDNEAHDSSPGDPVRKFIDEVAEEEDDSDNDLLRFEDDEEDEEEEEDDDLKDMIVSQFKEDPSDKERRNELHQKWLEQQDAAGTEKLLQKLKRGLQQDETSLSEDDDEDANDEEGAEDIEAGNDEDEDEEDPSHANSMRMKIKKIKEMIPLMFTDEDDVYVSSDDEEMEKKLLQQRMFKKMEQKTKLSSLTVDENTEEILRRIKKPEIRKKPKPTSFKDRTLMGINKNPAASKSSFLGRITKSSLSEGSRKRGSNIVRGYIFERDESNSKTSNSAPEEPSIPETIIQEKSRPRRAPAKFTASQSQERSSTLQATVMEKETSPRQRTTLYEILKMSSKKTCFTSGDTVISSNQTESIFAFKLDKKAVKSNT